MPLDKFGRHFLQNRSQPYTVSNAAILGASPMSTPFYICEPYSYHAKCIIYVYGISELSESSLFYYLDNGKVEYKFPVSGKIESIEISPSNVPINLNFENAVVAQKLEEKRINKGDTLQFNIIPNVSKDLYVQIVIQCSLEKDE